ncbi:BatD family protein [Pontiella sulfatireligans]|nr:BatD family protein [Pontiella sulfatireligans]
MDGWKTACLAAMLGLGAGAAEASTNFYAQASATETNVFLGQVFNLDVIVKAAEKPDAPQLTGLADFNATVLDAGKTTSATNTWLYRYALRAKREGELQIPALRLGGLTTSPIGIKANKPEATDRMKLELKLSKPSVYLSEPVLLTAVWDSTYQFGAIKAVDLHFPILNDKRFQTLELYEPKKENNAQSTGLPVHGTRVLATRNSYKAEATQHQSLSFSKLLVPKHSGTLLIQPATLLCAAEKEKDPKSKQGQRSAFQYPSYFDNTFFDQNVTGGSWTRIYTESAPLELEVKPLPLEGRPDLFNGMVGDFTILVDAEPTNVRVGEPVTLTITITAQEYMESIFFQPLRYQPRLVNHFEIPSDRSLPRREGKSKIYTQTIRPLSTSNTEVPPLLLAYFSPASNAYITVESAPIPLKVSPAEEIGVFGGSIYQSRLRAVEEGIRHNYEDPDMLESRRLPLFGWAHPFAVLGFLLLPPLLAGGYSLISLFGEKRHHIHRTAKAARAYKVFRKNAAHIVHSHSMKSEIYEDLDRVLRAYLGDRLHLTPGALSFRDAVAKLEEADTQNETIDKLRELFMVCEAYRFTHGFDEKANTKKIVHDAVQVIKNVEKTLK